MLTLMCGHIDMLENVIAGESRDGLLLVCPKTTKTTKTA